MTNHQWGFQAGCLTPASREVTFTYTAEGLPDTTIGTDTYVGDTAYNVMGQVME